MNKLSYAIIGPNIDVCSNVPVFGVTQGFNPLQALIMAQKIPKGTESTIPLSLMPLAWLFIVFVVAKIFH